jgi:threonine dehydrogenase-like Zn-dependent dehydrogenase
MKAALFDGKKLHLQEDYPEPNHEETIVKISLAGVCGTDLEILDGYMDYQGILGHEFVGIVVKSKNKDLIGKRVVGEINVGCGECPSCKSGMERHCPNRTVLGILRRDGAFAEFLALPEKNLHIIPDSVTDEQAVFVEPLAAAFEITQQVDLKSEWNVGIVGDGRLAQLIANVLKLYCAKIVCFGKHENKLANLKKFGIDTRLKIISDDEHRFDLVVEATGNNSGFVDAMKLVKPRGIVVLKSTIASKENLDLTSAVVNEVTLIGSRCGTFRPAIEALASGKISIDCLIDSTYPLNKFQEAIKHAKKPNTLKVFLKP